MENKTKELQGRYGHLLDNFTGDAPMGCLAEWEVKAESGDRYGHLLDNVKPDNTLYDNLMGIEKMCQNIRKQREEEYERSNIRMRERIEEEKARIASENAFVEYLLEKGEAERKASLEAEERRREAAERESDVLESLRRAVNIGNSYRG